MTPLEAAVVELTAVLDRLGIPCALIGGLAIAVWGEPRATVDVDLTLWTEPANMDAAVAAICRETRPLSKDPQKFVQSPLPTAFGRTWCSPR
jgi:hypothetical protein